MSVELVNLEAAIADVDREADDDFVDPRRLSAAIDRLHGKLCRVVAAAKKRGDHLLAGQSACSWVGTQCQMSKNAAADRLCVGVQLQSMTRIAEALSTGEIGFHAASTICHLQERVGQIDARIDEEMWIDNAKRFSIKDLRDIAASTWHAVDPVGGAAVKAAIESLDKPIGADDRRTAKQRRADALVEAMHHAMGAGTLPRRNGVRPHISVNTTIEGLKGELGAAASQLGNGMPISSKAVQRLACDGTCTGFSKLALSWSTLAERRAASRRHSGERSRQDTARARPRNATGPST